MQFLKLAESLDDILVLREFLGSLAERLLGLKILLEIKIAQIPVDLDHVVELLHIELIGVVQITELRGGNRSDLPPAVLELTEGREGGIHILLLLDQILQILDDSLLLREVILPLGVLLTVVLGTLLLIVGIDTLESGLHSLERVVLDL